MENNGVKIPAERLSALFKSGNAATDLEISGTLTRAEAKEVFDVIVEQSKFLQLVNTIPCDKLKMPIPVFDANTRQANAGRRSYTSGGIELTNIGRDMVLQDIQEYYNLPFHTVANNKDNPNFANEQLIRVAKVIKNDILDLAVNGTATEATTVTEFLEIYSGWIALIVAQAGEDDEPTRLYLGAADTTVSDIMSDILLMHPSKFQSEDNAFIMSPISAAKYKAERALGVATYSNAQPEQNNNTVIPSHLGYNIIVNPYLADTHTSVTITAIATSAAGADTTFAATAHGFTAGDKVKITGTIKYNGVHVVKAATDANNFTIEKAYVADATDDGVAYDPSEDIPTIIFTDPKNLVVGIGVGEMAMYHEEDPRTSGGVHQYTWNGHIAFEVSTYSSLTLAKG